MDEFSNGYDMHGSRDFDEHVHRIHVSKFKTKLLKTAFVGLVVMLLIVAVFG